MKKSKGRVKRLASKLSQKSPGSVRRIGPSVASRDASGEELYVFQLDGRIVRVNDHARASTGYTEEEFLGLRAWDLSPCQTAEGFAQLIEVLRSKPTHRLLGHNRRKDGAEYAVQACLWLELKDGSEHVFCQLRDALSYEALTEEFDQLISLIENSSEAVSIATPEGTCTYMNPAALQLLDIDKVEDVLTRPMVELHAPEVHEFFEGEVLPKIRQGCWEGELLFRNKKTGALIPCSVKAFPVRRSESGEVIGLATLFNDITLRKTAARHGERLVALNEVSRRVATSLLEHDDLNRAIGTILEGVGGILDIDRSYLCRYREDRRWVYRTHQWEPNDTAAQRVKPEPESSTPYRWATDRLVRGELICIPDLAAAGITDSGSTLGRDGAKALLMMPVVIHGRLESFFGFATTAALREWKDEEISIVQIIVDSFARAVERRIADREREMIARDLERSVARERKANRYKSEFLATMSHELRTPMNSIVGYAELLGRPNVVGEKRELWLANIRHSTDYLLSLINDVLDLSKIEAGQMTIESEPCSVLETISEVEELFRVEAEEKLLSFTSVYDGPVPESIVTDRVRLKQILINLVGNAIKFTRKGEVTLHVGMEPDQGERKGAFYVAVVDTGIGIAKDALGDLFHPFAQVHERTPSPFGGTGLGLDISRHLARLLGGRITVRSEVGVGSTFTLRLMLEASGPHVTTAPLSRPRVARQPFDGSFLRGCRILIVDDSADNREVLRFLLTEAGCTCESAENGALGVKAARAACDAETPFDVILMDMNMPVMDGYEATATLKQEGVDGAVIALTALAMKDDEKRCRAAGCVDYVAKPVVPSTFLETVARHVRIERLEPIVPSQPEDDRPARQEETFSLAGNPRFAALIRRYVESFPEQVAKLRSAESEQHWDVLQTLVHRLRGNASNYGYPEVTAAAGRCEDALAGGLTGAAVRSQVDRLVVLLEGIPTR